MQPSENRAFVEYDAPTNSFRVKLSCLRDFELHPESELMILGPGRLDFALSHRQASDLLDGLSRSFRFGLKSEESDELVKLRAEIARLRTVLKLLVD